MCWLAKCKRGGAYPWPLRAIPETNRKFKKKRRLAEQTVASLSTSKLRLDGSRLGVLLVSSALLRSVQLTCRVSSTSVIVNYFLPL